MRFLIALALAAFAIAAPTSKHWGDDLEDYDIEGMLHICFLNKCIN